MSRRCLLIVLCLYSLFVNAQTPKKQLVVQRTTSVIKVDGNLDESTWKNAVPAKDFIEWRPDFGKPEDAATKTVVYILYDNTSVYVGGYCYERTKDSISKELVGRDVIGVNDFVGVIFDTYNDKINGVGFYVTPLRRTVRCKIFQLQLSAKILPGTPFGIVRRKFIRMDGALKCAFLILHCVFLTGKTRHGA